MFGYHGRYLRVDLTQGTSEIILLSEHVLRAVLGGVGLGAWLLWHEAPVGIDPFAPTAPLIFALSPLVGTPLTTSAKFAVIAKSPLTGRINDALSSSQFALDAKKAGYDAIVLTGACADPAILIIDGDKVTLEPAGDLWGQSARVTHAALGVRLGTRFSSASIGPAGENRVRFATISHDNRHAGRGGLGAVLGSKRLKALAVAGNMRVELADPAAVVRAARDLSARSFGPATAKYRELGTVSNLLTFNRLATLPTRNFQQATFEHANELSGEALNAAHRIARRSCAACTIGCEHIYAAPDGGEVRLEYESLFALGPLCGIGDRAVVLRAAQLCDEYGMDTISTGATIAFAMECVQRGLLSDNDLTFGNSSRMLALVAEISSRTGLGDLLAEGTRRAAARIGGGSADFAPHVKGLEIPGYEPRTLQAMALGFAVGSRGADHNRSGAYEFDFSPHGERLHGSTASARGAIDTENRAALMDALILCKFLRGVFSDLWSESAVLVRAVTGWDVTAAELHQVAERIVTLKKLFNIREGWTSTEDTLPPRFLTERLTTGQGDAAWLPRERLEEMIAAYYQGRGWTATGEVPATLRAALGLEGLLHA